MPETITARCECGAIRFTSERPPLVQIICHCADCREATGEPFVRGAFFRLDGCRIEGSPAVSASFTTASGKRTTRESCPGCGAFLFDRSEGFPALIGVAAERIEPPFAFRPACHVWTGSKHPEVTIDDGLPQYAEGIPG